MKLPEQESIAAYREGCYVQKKPEGIVSHIIFRPDSIIEKL